MQELKFKQSELNAKYEILVGKDHKVVIPSMRFSGKISEANAQVADHLAQDGSGYVGILSRRIQSKRQLPEGGLIEDTPAETATPAEEENE